MDMQYYFDGSIPQHIVSDFIVYFEDLFRRCPSDAGVAFSMLTVGGKMCLDVTVNSAAMHVREVIQGRTQQSIKQGLKRLFSTRVSHWRRHRNEAADLDDAIDGLAE